jgi:chromosome segregation ATPase
MALNNASASADVSQIPQPIFAPKLAEMVDGISNTISGDTYKNFMDLLAKLRGFEDTMWGSTLPKFMKQCDIIDGLKKGFEREKHKANVRGETLGEFEEEIEELKEKIEELKERCEAYGRQKIDLENQIYALNEELAEESSERCRLDFLLKEVEKRGKDSSKWI